VFTGRRGGDGLVGSGRRFEVANAGELGVGSEEEDKELLVGGVGAGTLGLL